MQANTFPPPWKISCSPSNISDQSRQNGGSAGFTNTAGAELVPLAGIVGATVAPSGCAMEEDADADISQLGGSAIGANC